MYITLASRKRTLPTLTACRCESRTAIVSAKDVLLVRLENSAHGSGSDGAPTLAGEFTWNPSP